MLGRATRLAERANYSRSCIERRETWQGIQPAHTADIARGLPLAQIGERWPAVEDILQYILQENPRRLDK